MYQSHGKGTREACKIPGMIEEVEEMSKVKTAVVRGVMGAIYTVTPKKLGD